MFKFRIPGKPVPKQSLRYTYTGIRYIPANVKNYANKVRHCFLKEYKQAEPFIEPCKVILNIAVAIPKNFSKKKQIQALEGKIRPTVKPDCDNIAKNILDGLNKLAYADDKQIVELSITKFYNPTPFVDVEIYKV